MIFEFTLKIDKVVRRVAFAYHQCLAYATMRVQMEDPLESTSEP